MPATYPTMERLLRGVEPEARSRDLTAAEKAQEFLEEQLAKITSKERARRLSMTAFGGAESGIPGGIGAIDFVPFLGSAKGLEEGVRAARQAEYDRAAGRYGDAFLNYGASALGMLPGAAGTLRAAPALGRAAVDLARSPAAERMAGRLAEATGAGPMYMMPKDGRELKGALRPSNEPVRGQTSRELQRAQRKELTEQQKEKLETLSTQFPNFGYSSKFMTPQEIGKVIANPEGVREMNHLLEILPRASELASVAKAGEAKKGWYRASTQALMDVFGDDAPRFASLLAAMSPQTSVEMNLLNALNTWKNWTAAGRPQSAKAINEIMGRSVLGNKGEESVLDAWKNNAHRALMASDSSKITLSGPKVDSFYRNLADDVYRVTNDAWMANGLGVNQGLFSGSPTAIQIARGDPGLTPGYVGTSARLREAGQRAGMFPAEAQETTWSLFMPLYEMQAETGLPAREILQRGLLTPERVRGTPDFSTLLRDPKYSGILEEAGYGQQLQDMRSHQWGDPRMNLSLSEQRDLDRAAARLEQLKGGRERESRAKVFAMPSEPPQSGFAYATPEYIPGLGTGHLQSLITDPYGSRKNFSSRASSVFKDIQGKDILHGALGLDSIKTRSMQGAFRPAGDVPFAGGYLGGPSVSGRMPMELQPGFALGAQVPITKGLDVPQRYKDRLTAAEALRGSMTGQHGSPWNLQIPTERGESFFFPLEAKADPERMGLSAALQGGDTALADTGAGTAMINFGGPITREEAEVIGNRLGSSSVVPTKNVSDYVDYSEDWMQPEGSGAVTRKMLGYVNKLSEKEKKNLSKAVQAPAGDLYSLFESTARSRNDETRKDLMNLLRVLRDKGIPGVTAGLIAGEAFPAEQSKKRGGLASLQYRQGRD